MSRQTWIRIIEMVALLPATLVLMPLAAFASIAMILAIAQDAAKSWFTLMASISLVKMLGLLVGGVFGIAALWLALVLPLEAVVRTPTLRIVISLGILTGIADALYWLWAMARDQSTARTLSRSAWVIWILMLAGPLYSGGHQILRLLTNRAVSSVAVGPMEG